ncbi:MAG: hypothetical protein RR928_24370 [Comamonas sp.]|uniref:hypothetical protein n=1 Tax=Comamonas sp. TaxID=34028 RepID=UPI002FC79C94
MTLEQLLLVLATNQEQIFAQMDRIHFMEQLREKPGSLLPRLTALHTHHPEVMQQLQEVQQKYVLPAMHAMDYLQEVVLPRQLWDLKKEREKLALQLKQLLDQVQTASTQEPQPDTDTGTDAMPDSETTAAAAATPSEDHADKDEEKNEAEDGPDTQEVIPAIVGASSQAADHLA